MNGFIRLGICIAFKFRLIDPHEGQLGIGIDAAIAFKPFSIDSRVRSFIVQSIINIGRGGIGACRHYELTSVEDAEKLR